MMPDEPVSSKLLSSTESNPTERLLSQRWDEDGLPGESLVEFMDRTEPERMAKARAELHKEADSCDCGEWRGCPNTDRPRRRRAPQ